MNLISEIFKNKQVKSVLYFILFTLIVLLLYLVYNKLNLLREGTAIRQRSIYNTIRARKQPPRNLDDTVYITDRGYITDSVGNIVYDNNQNIFNARRKYFDQLNQYSTQLPLQKYGPMEGQTTMEGQTKYYLASREPPFISDQVYMEPVVQYRGAYGDAYGDAYGVTGEETLKRIRKFF